LETISTRQPGTADSIRALISSSIVLTCLF
jgi:hypothetical protein